MRFHMKWHRAATLSYGQLTLVFRHFICTNVLYLIRNRKRLCFLICSDWPSLHLFELFLEEPPGPLLLRCLHGLPPLLLLLPALLLIQLLQLQLGDQHSRVIRAAHQALQLIELHRKLVNHSLKQCCGSKYIEFESGSRVIQSILKEKFKIQ